MSTLKSLGYTATISGLTTNYLSEFVVQNNSNSPSNGGCCCLWTVPAGVTSITFEMWGGGGGGAMSCCCMQGSGGGAGGYGIKTVYNASGLGGCQYTICAASTSPASSAGGNGCSGSTSYVTGYGLSNFCAQGGYYGCSLCFWFCGCYTCVLQCCCAYAQGGDLNIPGYTGSAINTTWCQHHGRSYIATAPATISGPLSGPTGCNYCGCGWLPTIGSGGMTAHVYGGGCCYGGWGGWGMVSVTYG